MANLPWSLVPASGGPVFMIDDRLGQAGMFSRGILTAVRNIEKRQIIASVVAHADGERRTNSRTVAKTIQYSGHVWGNLAQTEDQLLLNLDIIEAAMMNGVQQLCLQPDGRYWNAELLSFTPKIVGGDPWHAEYDAEWFAADPFSYGTTTAVTVVTAQTMANVSGSLYAYSWTAGTSGLLGSVPSPLNVTVTLSTASGAFYVGLVNTSTTPNQMTAMISAPFLDADVLLFDSTNAQGTLTRAGVVTKSSLPVFPITLNKLVAAPTGLTLNVRASSAPVVTIANTYQARFL